MSETKGIVERLREPILADAFEQGRIADGALCERLIRERSEAADRIEALERANGVLDPAAESFHRRMVEAEAQLAAMRTALEPFKEAADYYSGEQPDDAFVDNDAVITVGHLRVARSALSSEPMSGDKP